MVLPTEMFDPLRVLIHAAESIDFMTTLLVCIVALAISIIGLLAYNRTKSRRMFLVDLAFFLFFIKYLLQLIDFFASPGKFFSDASQAVVELVALLLIFIAIFKR